MSTIDAIIISLINPPECQRDAIIAKAGAGATLIEVRAWEERHGYTLPDDYVRFLMNIKECRLHNKLTFLPLREIKPLADVIYGNCPNAPVLPKSWIAVAILGDSDYTVLDLATVNGQTVNILDGFHEEANFSLEIIAKSFTEFLERSIIDANVSTGGGAGHGYWSTKGPCYGEIRPWSVRSENP
jgi:hypothetical protein